MHMGKDYITGLLNFFIWGLGYIYNRKYILGFLWLAAFILAHLPMFYFGISFYQRSIEGTSLFMGHLAISLILLYLGVRKEAKSAKCWNCIKDNWLIFVTGAIIVGLLSEFANEFLVSMWWIYHPPWTLYGMFGSTVGLPLVGGWLLMVALALLFSFILTVYSKIRFFSAWVISWVVMGFLFETFNSTIWQTWHYPDNTIWMIFDVFGLDYGILVPIVGYGGTGVFTYLGYVVLSKFMKK